MDRVLTDGGRRGSDPGGGTADAQARAGLGSGRGDGRHHRAREDGTLAGFADAPRFTAPFAVVAAAARAPFALTGRAVRLSLRLTAWTIRVLWH